jgi:hypothetical protein
MESMMFGQWVTPAHATNTSKVANALDEQFLLHAF